MLPAVPKGAAGFFAVRVEPDLATSVRCGNKAPCVKVGGTMRERQGFTDKERHDRQERTSDAARAFTDFERVAREAKTARLRQQRLKAETALPAELAAKPKRNRKDKRSSRQAG
ncbi:conserved hypothetical protein [Mesorhizobium delmotii]|uniref:Uncharacterized protein n=1 Tax=Mesorhizobium delmotii TaxID=1631247 RepID=A0A2P9AQ92_9HYPH|nr:conserved hypothetical protein [Mesorhizobium delmotii]